MKYKIALFLAWGAAMAAVFLTVTPDAKADDASYLAAVGGIYHVWPSDMMLPLGHSICGHLKDRTAEQQIAIEPTQMALVVDVPGVVYAAQRELCPTLGH